MQLWATSSLNCSSYRQTFEQIEQAFGRGAVPQVFSLLESQPVLLTHLWGQFHTLVLHGALPRVLKEMVGLVVATTTHCAHIRALLLHSLTQQYVEQATLATIAQGDYQTAAVSHATRTILQYAALAITNSTAYRRVPQKKWQLLHHETARALDDTGLEESEQLELIATIALFEQLCTVANLLKLDAD